MRLSPTKEREEPKEKAEASTDVAFLLSKPMSLAVRKKCAGYSHLGSLKVGLRQSRGITRGLQGPAEGRLRPPSRAKPLQGFK